MYECAVCGKLVLRDDTMTNVCGSCEAKLMSDDDFEDGFYMGEDYNIWEENQLAGERED